MIFGSATPRVGLKYIRVLAELLPHLLVTRFPQKMWSYVTFVPECSACTRGVCTGMCHIPESAKVQMTLSRHHLLLRL